MKDIITLINEDGEEEEFHLIASFGLDDQDYAALVDLNDENTILFFRMDKADSEELILEGINDEGELDAVIDAFEELES